VPRAYLILFPYARVLVLLVFGFFARLVYVPAVIVLGFWIVVQFRQRLVTIGSVAAGRCREPGGTAWFRSHRRVSRGNRTAVSAAAAAERSPIIKA